MQRLSSWDLDTLISAPGFFRLILAYVVVVGHFTPLHLGSAAVYLFFMLSGFWIYRMWKKEYQHTTAPYRNFLVSRFWRLLPVYYVALLLWLGLNPLLPNPTVVPHMSGRSAIHFWLSHLIILGYAPLPYAHKILAAVWSLDIELQFYLIAPLIIAIVSKYALFSWQRLSLYTLALVGLAAFVLLYNGHFYLGLAQEAFLPMYLAFFLIGLESARQEWKPSSMSALSGLVVGLLLVAISFAIPSTRELLFSRKIHGMLANYGSVANIVVALFVATYAMATVRKQPGVGSWFSGIDRTLGYLSYEVYLLDADVELVVSHVFGNLSRHARLPIVIVAMLLLLPLSWLVYRYIDKPIDKARAAWVRSRRVKEPPKATKSETALVGSK